MVRNILIVLVLWAYSGSALAQTIDWSRSGGDLFGRAQAPSAAPAEGEAAVGPVRLPASSQPFQDAVDAAALAHGLDPKLLHALVLTESAYRPGALSPAGAAGLTQLMPGTARELGVRDRFDPDESLRGGADYLAQQLVRFGDLRLALAAFNAGPGRVARLGRVPNFAETEAYVATVIACFLALTAGRTVTSSSQCALEGDGR